MSKKNNILSFSLLLMFMVMYIFTLISMMSDGTNVTDMQMDSENAAETFDFFRSTIFITSFIGVIASLAIDPFKAEIDSGWLRYSFTIPITPVERVIVRYVKQASTCLCSFILVNIYCLIGCLIADIPFKLDYIVIEVLVFAFMLFLRISDNIFIRPSRTEYELKKNTTKNGIITFAIAIIAAIIFAVSKHFRFYEIKQSLDIPELGISELIAGVALIIVFTAVNFLINVKKMSSYYSSKSVSEVRKSEAFAVRESIAKKSNGAVGLLYKEIKQNWIHLLIIAALPLLSFLFLIVINIVNKHIDEDVDSTDAIVSFNIALLIMTAYVISSVTPNFYNGDEKKLWAYFITASPEGIKGFIYYKYVLIFAAYGIFLVSQFIEQTFAATYMYLAHGIEMKIQTGLVTVLFFVMLFASALDIPFCIRFGPKKGSIIKVLLELFLFIIIVIVISNMPEKWNTKLLATMAHLLKDQENISDNTVLILSFLPFVSLGTFYLSYLLSCKLFMKGVSEYDK